MKLGAGVIAGPISKTCTREVFVDESVFCRDASTKGGVEGSRSDRMVYMGTCFFQCRAVGYAEF